MEIRALITALGNGIASSFDVSKLRYHCVMIMTDVGVHGAHVSTLLLTFFFRYMATLPMRPGRRGFCLSSEVTSSTDCV